MHKEGMPRPAVRHLQRATREAGQKPRSRLLDAATGVFLAQGFAATSMTEIATAADCFPSQVSYYFRTKEALFVEAACRELLHLGAAAEKAAADSQGRAAYVDALVNTVAPSPALLMMIEAIAISRRSPDLTAAIARTFERLHDEGARALATEQSRRKWRGPDPAEASKRFWTLALGVSLRVAGTGGAAATCAEELRIMFTAAPITNGRRSQR